MVRQLRMVGESFPERFVRLSAAWGLGFYGFLAYMPGVGEACFR